MSHSIRHRSAAACRLGWAAVLVLTMAGCQTTGDPREGGLFGWSEARARDRQAALEAQSDAASKTADAEKRRGESLSRQQEQLRSEAAGLQAQLTQLLAENDSLDHEIRALIGKRQVSAATLARLHQTLADNEQARADARRAAAQPVSQQSSMQLSSQADKVGQYNERLQREVMLLMGR